ncbi:MAG: AraC family transcriptional regulator [Paenibacillaceae bacterium]|nr:AraC family transcriptional regulator [Paenibacillaceae bacterium]
MRNTSLKRISFKYQLVVFAILLSTVPVIVLGFVASWLMGSNLQKESERNDQIVLGQVQDRVDAYFRSLEQISLALAANPVVEEMTLQGASTSTIPLSVQLKNLFENTVTQSDVKFDITLLMPKYNTSYSNELGMNRQIEYPLGEVVKQMQTGHIQYLQIPPRTFPNQNDLLIARTVPLNTANFQGLIVVHLKTGELQRLIDRLELGGDKFMLIVDDRHQLVAGGTNALQDGVRSAESPDYASIAGREPLPATVTIQGIAYTITSVKSRLSGWTYLVLSSDLDKRRKVASMQRLTWFTVLAVSLAWGLLAVFGMNRMFSPFQRLLNSLRHQLNEQTPVVQEHLVQRLIRGELSAEDMERKGDRFPLAEGPFYVGIAEIDQPIDFKKRYSASERARYMAEWKRIADETFRSPAGKAFTFVVRPDQLVYVSGIVGDSIPEREAIRAEQAEAFRLKVREHGLFTMSVAVSDCRSGPDNLTVCYEEAETFMHYRWTRGTDVTLSSQDLSPSMNVSNRELIRMEQALVSGIAHADFAQAEAMLDELIVAASETLRQPEAIAVLFTHLLGEIDKLLEPFGSGVNELLGDEALRQLYGLSSVHELRTWMVHTVFAAIREQHEHMRHSTRKKSIQQALVLMRTELEQDLSLQMLAERMDVSSATMSKWFKEETGEYFGDCLIRMRMDKAKEWLIHSDMPIKTIAERLRYATVPNFTRIFKQTRGMPPAAFRNQYRGGSE